MKRLFAMILALAMVFSLSMTAFATDGSTTQTGSITITNATVGQTYTIFKILDATLKIDQGEDDAEAVSYYIDRESQFFEEVTQGDGLKYFVYNEKTKSVIKHDNAIDSELIKYLTDLVVVVEEDEEGNKTVSLNQDYTHAGQKVAVDTDDDKPGADLVVFDNLPYGYYLVVSNLGATVTISSNTPDVNVIDKNQQPGTGFKKVILVPGTKVVDGVTQETTEEVATASAAIGDRVDYLVSFEATNYSGANQVRFYQIFDDMGVSLAGIFDSFEVSIDGEKKDKGWFLDNSATKELQDKEGKIGPWDGVSKDDADWYLVYRGNNSFRITMPWLTNHKIAGETGGYTLTYPETDDEGNAISHVSKYGSPVHVEAKYSAYVKSNAPIGGGTHDALTNKAYASWTSAHDVGNTTEQSVVTEVFGIGLQKEDGATKENLSGAYFRVWKDNTCKDPLYIIPTDIEGVYVLDSHGSNSENYADSLPSRAVYAVDNSEKGNGAGRLTAYLAAAPKLEKNSETKEQENYVVTPVNGKVVILGLKAGMYYLEEVVPPAGYNALTAAKDIQAGQGQRPFPVFANSEGKVADIQTAGDGYTNHSYNITSALVSNSKGVELPSTGGAGTMMLITIGSMVAMAFAVLMITQKKMSVYKD